MNAGVKRRQATHWRGEVHGVLCAHTLPHMSYGGRNSFGVLAQARIRQGVVRWVNMDDFSKLTPGSFDGGCHGSVCRTSPLAAQCSETERACAAALAGAGPSLGYPTYGPGSRPGTPSSQPFSAAGCVGTLLFVRLWIDGAAFLGFTLLEMILQGQP